MEKKNLPDPQLDAIYERFWTVIELCEARCPGCAEIEHKPGEGKCSLAPAYVLVYRRYAAELDEALVARNPTQAWERERAKNLEERKRQTEKRAAKRKAALDKKARARELEARRFAEETARQVSRRLAEKKRQEEYEAAQRAKLPPPTPPGYKRVYNRSKKKYDMEKLCPCCGGKGWINPEDEAPIPPPEKGRLINLDFDEE